MEDLRVRRGLMIPGSELKEAASRSSGPGGQHVNKTSTRVTLRWNVKRSEALTDRQRSLLQARLGHRLTTHGDLIVHASSRSQARNREAARERLAQLVVGALQRQRSRIATKASRRAIAKGAAAKRRKSEMKRTRRRPGPEDA